MDKQLGVLGRLPASTHAANTRGFTTLADEIYLEIISYIPSVPIPSLSSESCSHPTTRRSRHETLLSLSQTSRSLRRFFWRYLWQRIEVRKGMKIGDQADTLPNLSNSSDATGHKNYAIELVRQLEIVTVRNPQLAQYVNYLDIVIGEYSIKNVLAELARCLNLFSNLHTVQIDLKYSSQRSFSSTNIFEQTFKKRSYPQIRNVFLTSSTASFAASCPQARCIGFRRQWMEDGPYLRTMMDNCPHLEVLACPENLWKPDVCKLIVDHFLNLRTIQIIMYSSAWQESSPLQIDILDLEKLNHLQTIIIDMKQSPTPGILSLEETLAVINRRKEGCIKSAKRVLIQIQLRDNLEKTIVLQETNSERRILLEPRPRFVFEEGSSEI